MIKLIDKTLMFSAAWASAVGGIISGESLIEARRIFRKVRHETATPNYRVGGFLFLLLVTFDAVWGIGWLIYWLGKM